VASRLQALGGHVARRMRGALRLGIQKTLGVVQLHYQVNLATLATGYTSLTILTTTRCRPGWTIWTLLLLLPPTSLLTTLMRSSRRPPRALKVVGHSGP
jgi:hypothetical protein